uniref:protein-serine/threonine phosphatase n=1 Tax=Apopellia endiviifolia (species B) TaxID=119729 RepID=A0A6B7NSX5_9MARC|nr:protein phosphatase 2C [Apopellia endiviifolia (species B)]
MVAKLLSSSSWDTLSDRQVIVREQMERMGAGDCGSICSFMEGTLPFDSGAIAARRRRMEIRRFKLIASCGTFLEPHNKRLRSLQGHPYTARGVGELPPLCNPEYDFVLRHPVDNDESRRDGHPRQHLRCEGAQAIMRHDTSTPSSIWEVSSPTNSVQNSSSGEDESASSGSGSTSSGSSSMSSDSTSTSLESNEMEGGSIATWTVAATHSNTNITDSSAQKDTSLDNHHTHEERPLHWQVSSAERDQSNLSALPAASSSSSSVDCTAHDQCPPHGMVSVCGRRREMEDAVTAVPAFLSLPCDMVGCNCRRLEPPGFSTFHFFGVYDGHGGSQAAIYCADHLHLTLAEEMKVVINAINSDPGVTAVESWVLQWQKAMSACFLRMDAEIGGVCWRGVQCGKLDGSIKCCAEPIAPETVGSTAVVAVVSSCQLIIANCGDSRAVLSRGGHAIALSHDHKPEREDEMARVEAAGGRVIFWNGYRVLGVLAMSRAIGDRYLKPYVIAEPEVTCTLRTEEDECLILASDGLWDVLSNDVVCDIARKCLSGHRSSSASADPQASSSCNEEIEESPAAVAAALLTKLALARGSGDNISVVVVDLMSAVKR